MIIGVAMQSLVLGYITFKTDWNEQVNNNDDKLHIYMYHQCQWYCIIEMSFRMIIHLTMLFIDLFI
jgi:hypothetical protein